MYVCCTFMHACETYLTHIHMTAEHRKYTHTYIHTLLCLQGCMSGASASHHKDLSTSINSLQLLGIPPRRKF